IMEEAGAGVGVHEVQLAGLGLQVKIVRQGRQEDRVRPAQFDIQQIAGSNVIGGVDATADQFFGLVEVSPSGGDKPPVEQGGDRQAGAAAGPVVAGLSGAASQARGSLVQQAEYGSPSVVHGDDPIRQAQCCFAGVGVSGQKVIVE